MFDGSNQAQSGQPPQQPQQPPEAIEIALAQEWQALQLANQHLAEVLGKLTEAWRRDRASLAAATARIAELEKAAAEPTADEPEADGEKRGRDRARPPGGRLG